MSEFVDTSKLGSDQRDGLRMVGEDLLGKVTQITGDLWELGKQLDGYSTIPDETMLPLSEAAVRFLIGMIFIEGRTEPSPEQMPVLRAMLSERARLGVPLGVFLFHIQRGQQALWEAATESVARLGLGSAMEVVATRRVVSLVVAIVREATDVYRQIEIEAARSDEQRRTGLLRAILLGESSNASHLDLATYGLRRDRIYIAVRGRADTEAETMELRRTLAIEVGDGALFGTVGGDVAGLVTRRPSLPDIHATVGLGFPGPIDDIPGSFTLASRALDTASAFGLRGVFDLDDLRLKLPIAAEVRLGGHLVERFLSPLHQMRDEGDAVKHTLVQLFEHGMSIESAARGMHAHPNTLRYRLRRFEELTGADLTNTETAFAVWWALQYDALAATGYRKVAGGSRAD